jgi:hypothetical protein
MTKARNLQRGMLLAITLFSGIITFAQNRQNRKYEYLDESGKVISLDSFKARLESNLVYVDIVEKNGTTEMRLKKASEFPPASGAEKKFKQNREIFEKSQKRVVIFSTPKKA